MSSSAVVEEEDYIGIPVYNEETGFVQNLIDDGSLIDVAVVPFLQEEKEIVEVAGAEEEQQQEQIDIVQDVITINEAEEDIINGDELKSLEGHTIFLHNGKQYLIPNDAGNSIVLQDEDGNPMEFIINNNATEMFDTLDNQEQLIIDGDSCITAATTVDSESTADEINQYLTDANSSDKCYMVLKDNEVNLDTANLEGEQFAAFIKDGQIHFEATDLTCEQIAAADGNGIIIAEDEHSLEERLESEDNVEQIMGKNLITGETITLSGLFNRMKKQKHVKHEIIKQEPLDDNNFDGEIIAVANVSNSRKRKFSENFDDFDNGDDDSSIFKRKIPVGVSVSGKKVYGRILEIRKSDPQVVHLSEDVSMKELQLEDGMVEDITETIQHFREKESIEEMSLQGNEQEEAEQEQHCNDKIEELLIDNTGKILKIANLNETVVGQRTDADTQINVHAVEAQVQKVGKLDYTISKTLSGLMELETVQKRLMNKDLTVKVINKKITNAGILKSVSYLYGTMHRRKNFQNNGLFNLMNSFSNMWTFKLDRKKHGNQMTEQQDSTKAFGGASGYGANVDEEDEDEETQSRSEDVRLTECLTLSIVENMNGSQKTRVTIPNLGVGTKCDLCLKNFKSEQQLKKHMLQHSNPKSAACDICPKSFADSSALTRHKRIHADERKYPCDACGKCFNSSANLRRHVMVHDPLLRPLQCLTCFQRFTDESSLRKHILIHTGVKAFSCDTCDKKFLNQGDLNFHRRIHDPNVRYNCEICNKGFSRYSNLTRHKEIHKETKDSFICIICGCAYNFISSLTRHMVTSHIKPDSS